MIRIWLDYLKMNKSQRLRYRREKSRAAFLRQIRRIRNQPI